ncbi:flagellar biosynthesis protein FliQ [Ureibacillus thermophilus]|uniref:Flagellar biosynthetic protein FliQ n=1 Tax=Ureibacillus thermophilus TaxID=367743 RepID=A0A4P6UU83_9BACL|nr:flagellar biosynthesis protein FliQ [Ureibacillus thermophilus]QBK25646.1 flagellar biosynthesis protein FliQ [Ureibacillus thermophilus]
MSQLTVIQIAEQAVWVVLLVAGPLMLVALVTGLIISIFQATTSIQEQTLAFAPKIIAVLVAIVFFGPWMVSRMSNYFSGILGNLTRYIG